MSVYYNEWDAFPAAWLEELQAAGMLPTGPVDRRSIADVEPGDLAGFAECHFFAGIGGWPYALALAGWPAGRPVWTASLPCQPFSNAGLRRGADDERHLWPVFARLAAECRPPTVFGEQVASRAGRDWLAGVRADLETLGYAVGAADLCAAGVGAPHIRQRLYWVAQRLGDSSVSRLEGWRENAAFKTRPKRPVSGSNDTFSGVANGDGATAGWIESNGESQSSRDIAWLPDTDSAGPFPWSAAPSPPRHWGSADAGHWGGADWIECLDGKWRRIPAEPCLFPLADGFPNRVGMLRGAGNAIVPQVAAEFVRAAMAGSAEALP